MSKTRFVLVPLLGLIVIGLLVVGGWAIHRIGWSQGYAIGQLAAGVQEGTAPLSVPHGFSYAGLFLAVGLVLLLLIVIGKFFRMWAWMTVGAPWMMAGGSWKMARRPNGEYWPRHWHRHHGPIPPWFMDWEKPSEEKNEKAQPDAETGNAEAQS